MLIFYGYDTNAILVISIKSRSDTDMLHAHDVLYAKLETMVHAPKLNIMDNKSSTALK